MLPCGNQLAEFNILPCIVITSTYIPGHQKIPSGKAHPALASKDLNTHSSEFQLYPSVVLFEV